MGSKLAGKRWRLAWWSSVQQGPPAVGVEVWAPVGGKNFGGPSGVAVVYMLATVVKVSASRDAVRVVVGDWRGAGVGAWVPVARLKVEVEA